MPERTPVPLAELTTLRVGGTPERLIEVSTREEFTGVLREAWSAGEDVLVLGGGSNVLIGDEPYEGVVVLVRTSGIEVLPEPAPGIVRVRAEAGHPWDELSAWSVAHGLSGIEAMAGIPGTVGAAPIQNVGAYGQEIVDTLVEVELIDESSFEVSVVPASELGLGLRTSVLKSHYHSAPERRAIVLSVTLDLAVVGAGERVVHSARLRDALGLEAGAAVTLQWIREHVLRTRRGKGMVLDETDADTTSAGSFFQNPVVSAEFAASLPAACPRWPIEQQPEPMRVVPLDEYGGVGPVPAAPRPRVKLSAAWLIEHAGLRRGFALPGSRAALSGKHALALTNRGGASAEEIAQLARFVQQRVQQDYGLILQPEPVLVGIDV